LIILYNFLSSFKKKKSLLYLSYVLILFYFFLVAFINEKKEIVTKIVLDSYLNFISLSFFKIFLLVIQAIYTDFFGIVQITMLKK